MDIAKKLNIKFIIKLVIVCIVSILFIFIFLYFNRTNDDWAESDYKQRQSMQQLMDNMNKEQKQKFNTDNIKTLDQKDVNKIKF